MNEPNQERQDDEQWVSKTQLKHEAQQLKQLGQQICELKPAFLATVPISESMIEAVALAKRLTGKREAYRRHMNYIGKLMRTENIEAIEQAMEKIKNRHLYAQQHHHKLEQVAIELLESEQSDDLIQQLLEQYPSLDRQKLRQQVRSAKRQTQQSPEQPIDKFAKELQSYLGEHIHRD